MLETLCKLVVDQLGDRTFSIASVVAAVGVCVWLLGARCSKSILALMGAALGAWLGTRVPHWYGWNFDGMAIGMAGALFLGLSGYVLNTTWLTGSLAISLSLMFAMTAWALMAGDVSWHAPDFLDLGSTQTERLQTIWRTMPGDLPRVMPFVISGGALLAVVFSVLWPRMAKAASWSLIGLALIAAGGGIAISVRWPGDGGRFIPAANGGRVALLWGLTIVGTLVQWWSLPPDPTALPKQRKSKLADKPNPSSSNRYGGFFTGGAKL